MTADTLKGRTGRVYGAIDEETGERLVLLEGEKELFYSRTKAGKETVSYQVVIKGMEVESSGIHVVIRGAGRKGVRVSKALWLTLRPSDSWEHDPTILFV